MSAEDRALFAGLEEFDVFDTVSYHSAAIIMEIADEFEKTPAEIARTMTLAQIRYCLMGDDGTQRWEEYHNLPRDIIEENPERYDGFQRRSSRRNRIQRQT